MQYEIKGTPFPAVICHLQDGEQMITEGGGMSWMTPNMVMETTTNGGLGKAFGRLFSFTSCCPGNIRAVEIHPGQSVICQKSAFLASTPGVNMSIYFKKALGAGLFGGEGFIMQKFEGEGVLFVELDGSTVEYELQAGEQLVLDTGHLAIMDGTCSMDIQTVKGAKNIFFGGEGLFNTIVTGPGKIVLQTLPVNKLALELYRYMPQSGGNG